MKKVLQKYKMTEMLIVMLNLVEISNCVCVELSELHHENERFLYFNLYATHLYTTHYCFTQSLSVFLAFGLTRAGIEPWFTVSAADALSTRSLIGFVK